MKKRLFRRNEDDLPGFLLTLKCTSFSLHKYQKTHHSSVPGSNNEPSLVTSPASSVLQLPWDPICTPLAPYFIPWVPRTRLCTLMQLRLLRSFHCQMPYKQLGPPLHIPPRPLWGGTHIQDLFRAMPHPVFPFSGLFQRDITSVINYGSKHRLARVVWRQAPSFSMSDVHWYKTLLCNLPVQKSCFFYTQYTEKILSFNICPELFRFDMQ